MVVVDKMGELKGATYVRRATGAAVHLSMIAENKVVLKESTSYILLS